MDTGKKIQYLEGIRGVAAMMVVMHHFLLAFFPSYYFGGDPATAHLPHQLELRYWQNPLSVFTNGEFMVALFFVLSGYVLSRSYFQKPQIETLVSGASRRFLRLYIPLAVALILAFIALRCNFGLIPKTVDYTHSSWLTGTALGDRTIKSFLPHLLYNTMFNVDNVYVTSSWTISLELYGSIMVFALLALTHRTSGKWFFFITTGLVAYFLFNDFYMAFIIGIFLNYLERIPLEKIRLRWLIVSVLLIAGLFMGGFPTWQFCPDKETFYKFATAPIFANNTNTIHFIGAALVIMAAMLSKTFQKIFSGKLFVFLGDISFSAYLIHPIIVTTLSLWVFLTTVHATHKYSLSVLVSLIVTIAATLIMGKIMTVFVDKPGVRFSKYFYNRFFKSKEESLA